MRQVDAQTEFLLMLNFANDRGLYFSSSVIINGSQILQHGVNMTLVFLYGNTVIHQR